MQLEIKINDLQPFYFEKKKTAVINDLIYLKAFTVMCVCE